MWFISMLLNKHRKKVAKRNELCDNYIQTMENTLREFEELLKNSTIIDSEYENQWKSKLNNLIALCSEKKINGLKKAKNFNKLINIKSELVNNANVLGQRIKAHNQILTDSIVQDVYNTIGKIEGNELDTQQLLCIAEDTHNHLVIAGAGTGKTTTILGKIKYLIKTKKCLPDDILVLSFTNKSALEMKQRISEEIKLDIETSTFHKLGISIITSVNGIAPRITKIELRDFIKKQLTERLESKWYKKLFAEYLYHNQVAVRNEFDFQSMAEYEEYLKQNQTITIKKEKVKSYGEMNIANFLNQNSVDYCYELPYKIDTRTNEYNQYYPDFYLPEYDIYIEYFGINRNGEVPKYFKSRNGMTATEAYRCSMDWKRKLHNEYNTKLIECYAYENSEGILFDNLAKKLNDYGVKLLPKEPEQLMTDISQTNESIISTTAELFMTIINLIKCNNYTFEDVKRLNYESSDGKNNRIILELVEPIFNDYCNALSTNDEIDFNDMINIATKYVADGKYNKFYKYVIIDEYQDISKSRFSLIKQMRIHNDFNLFCVGDDWQSIYRFAGSDIDYILNFEKYWGKSKISKIEKTYRFPQKLVDISGGFIMKNPAQIKKQIQACENNGFLVLGEINAFNEKIATDFMIDKLNDLDKNSSVFFIGRFEFDKQILNSNAKLKCRYNNDSKNTEVIYDNRPDLKMIFITAHKSKGLQADYVFIINNKNKRLGFPSKIQDKSIINLLLQNDDLYPYSEERRLYYVALTRAKKKVFLLTAQDYESEFVLELRDMCSKDLKKEKYECPKCGGQLRLRKGPYGEFFGCSNYFTQIQCKYIRPVKRKNSIEYLS